MFVPVRPVSDADRKSIFLFGMNIGGDGGGAKEVSGKKNTSCLLDYFCDTQRKTVKDPIPQQNVTSSGPVHTNTKGTKEQEGRRKGVQGEKAMRLKTK